MIDKTRLCTILAAASLAAGPVLAGEDLAKKHGCASCHALDKKTVGPSWKDVAVKYKGDAKAAEDLFKKVKTGGKGVWGQVPMPPQTKVGDADLKQILAWVLAQ